MLLVALATTLLLVPGQCWRLFDKPKPKPKPEGDAPWFCHDLDCPTYKVLETTDEYEVRVYDKAAWVSTVVPDVTYITAVSRGFMRLFHYIGGDNEDNVKIPMTAPVRTRIEPGQGPYCTTNFTVSFFVPFDNQGNPPVPSNPDVFVETTSSLKVYVASFPGFARDDEITMRAATLHMLLEKDGIEVEEGHYYFAGYDAPFRLFNRHNEVWLPAAGKSMANA